MKHTIILFLCTLLPWLGAKAQFNTGRLIISGRSALYYEDYVLSIQYFNQAITAKPHLYEPWFYRGLAKFYLDDFEGAEDDVTHAIELNPYISNMYELRGLARIRTKKFSEAISDYDHSLAINPHNQSAWYNRALCRVETKDYGRAQLDLDTITAKWKNFAGAYSMKAEVFLMQNDTTSAVQWLDRSIKIDPYDAATWTMKAMISLARSEWKDADEALTKAIHLKPKNVNNYVNRALARYNTNNLRGAMADYDMAIDLAPDNFLAHYNRGLLRMQLGDDNRAITDFDYVLHIEPHNVLAIFNRALLLDRTGNLHAAIRDYSDVISQFPNFWTGLSRRAACYRRLGMTAKAEADEFRIMKAQMDKHLGIQPRWSSNKRREVRKRSDIDPEKYNRMVVADENTAGHEYKNAYRGRVQNRKTAVSPMPMYHLSLMPYDNGVASYQAFSAQLERFNMDNKAAHLFVNCNPRPLDANTSQHYFARIDSLTTLIDACRDMHRMPALLLQRAVAESVTQNYDAALADLDICHSLDSTSVLVLWQRAYCQTMMNDFDASHGNATELKQAMVVDDITHAIELDPQNQYLYYNRANAYIENADYRLAIDDYTCAIDIDHRLAEAYFNRGLARIRLGQRQEGIADLSKAGELGLYRAYSLIKQVGRQEDGDNT